MINPPQQALYEQCNHDIEIAFESILSIHSANANQLSVAWLYGGLPKIFVWYNLSVVGIDLDEWCYYIDRLHNTILTLNKLADSSNEPPHCRNIYTTCAQSLQHTYHRLSSIRPNQQTPPR